MPTYCFFLTVGEWRFVRGLSRSLLLRGRHTVNTDVSHALVHLVGRKGGIFVRLVRIGGATDWVALILGVLLMFAVKFGLITRVPW